LVIVIIMLLCVVILLPDIYLIRVDFEFYFSNNMRRLVSA
jgi:hypothetical protein